jgi:hypothetical protein
MKPSLITTAAWVATALFSQSLMARPNKLDGPVSSNANLTQRGGPLLDSFVGPEGFGPHIERARTNKDAELAKRSLTWLNICATHPEMLEVVERGSKSGRHPDDKSKAVLEDMRSIGRHCQTVGSEHHAHRAELLAIAMVTHPSVATDFVLFHRKDVPADTRPVVARGLLQDAQRGSVKAMIAIRDHGANLGIGEDQIYVNAEAVRRLPSELRDNDAGVVYKPWYRRGPSAKEKVALEPLVVAAVNRVLERHRK